MDHATQLLTAHTCPKCGAPYDRDQAEAREYRCPSCDFELAHLDFASNGAIRGIFGWLKSVGDIIQDRYEVQSVLGKGGFGATYLVKDLRLNGKRRAVKEIPELLFDEYETAILAALNHPAIPDIIDRSMTKSMVYLVLEYGGTRTLSSECRRMGGRIPLSKLTPWIRQLCEVLTYLHTREPPIIHRDLKPENILLDEHERVMLIDFGIAKQSVATELTRTLGRAASHGFSPPEQAMGTGTDQRSDIYALAATLYYVMTGIVPPAAHERVSGHEVVPLSEMVPEVPPALEDIIQRSLSLNVNQRPQTIAEIMPALTGLESSVTAAPTDRGLKTVAIADLTQPQPRGGTSKPPSIKVPSLRASQAVAQPGTEALPAERSGLKPGMWLAIVGVPAALVAIAAGIYLNRPATTTPPAAPEIAKPVRPPAPTAPEAKPPGPPTAPASETKSDTKAAARPEAPPAAPPSSTAGTAPAAPAAGKPQNLMNEFEKLRQGKSSTETVPLQQPPVANIEPLPAPGSGTAQPPAASKPPPRRISKPPPVARTAPPKPPRSPPPRRSAPRDEPPPRFEFQIGPTVKKY